MTPTTNATLAAAVGRAAMSNALLVPAQAVLALTASALIARSLGTTLFGTYAVFNALRSSLLFFTDAGMSVAGSKFFPELVEREGRQGAIRLIGFHAISNLTIGIAWIALLFFAGSWCLRMLNIPPEHAYIIGYAAAGLLVEEGSRVAYVFLWARFAHHRVNLANLIGTAALPGLVILVVIGGGGLRSVLLASIAAMGIRMALLWIAVVLELRSIPERSEPDRVPHLFTRFLKLGGISWIEKLSAYLYGGSFVTLVLATVLDRAAVGQFALSLEFTVRVLSFVLSPTHGIILPAVSSVFARGTPHQRQRLFTATLRVLGLWLAPAGVLLIAIAPYVIPWLYSATYTPAIRLTQVLAFFYFIEYAIYSPANSVLLADERLRTYGKVKLLSLLLVPLFVIGTRVLTLQGIVLVYGLLRLAAAAGLLAAAVRVQQLQLPGGFYLRVGTAAASALSLALLTAAILGPAAWAAVVTAIVAVAATLFAYRALDCLGGDERDTFQRLNLPGTERVLRFFQI